MNKDKRYIEIFRAALEEYPCSGGAEASIGFFYGALWADKHPNFESLWHDASERPKENSEILIQWNIKGNSGFESYHTSAIGDWAVFIEKYGVSRWAYISDLLPKQFGNSEQLKGDDNNKIAQL